MQRATVTQRLAKLEKSFWNPPGDPEAWTQLLNEFKAFLESGTELANLAVRDQIVRTVDAFLYSLSRRIASVDPVFGSVSPWIEFIKKSFSELRLTVIEAEYIETVQTTYAHLCR
jgi:hypothetical protein